MLRCVVVQCLHLVVLVVDHVVLHRTVSQLFTCDWWFVFRTAVQQTGMSVVCL